jgi:hypothetical protein
MALVERWNSTPRELDEVLGRIARGDRGCLPDAVAGTGALLLFAALVMSSLEILGTAWVYVGAGVWVGGFAWGVFAQGRSTRVRRAAMESAPLVLGRVVHCDPHLGEPGKRVGRALVVLSLRDPERLAPEGLVTCAEALRGGPADLEREAPAVHELLGDPFEIAVVPIPKEIAGRSECFAARVVVFPDRLETGVTGPDEVIPLVVDPVLRFAEQLPARTDT